MRQITFLLPFLFHINLSVAQDIRTNGYFVIPDSLTNTTDNIAGYVDAHFKGEENKVHAIYNWVVSNIRYDKDSSYAINAGINPDAKVTVALKRRRGVCENFAAIFNDICLKTGITSFVINGYTKQSGSVDKAGHSWCSAIINKNWYLFDPTWDAGSGINPQYFMVQPTEFIVSHMPYDPLWQLLYYPVTQEQFYSGNIYKNKTDYFNYPDSVTAYIQMDSLNRFQSAAHRIQQQGLYNSGAKDNYNYIKMNVEMQNQENDLELYNSAMTDLNDATAVLNNFIQYRNNQFTPEKTDAELRELLIDIDNKVDSALKKLDEVDKSKATLVLGTEPARERLNALSKKIQEQKVFLNQYLNTAINERKKLFY